MKYKIKVFLNRITIDWQTAFNKAKAYHLKHGVDIQFIFHQIDIHGYTSVWNDFKKRWLIQGAENLVTIDPTADANIFVFNEAEWATPAGSQFPLRLDTPNGSCMAINGKPFINIGTYDKEDQAIDYVEIVHEIMHSYVQNANAKGMAIQDVMDTYFHNSDPDYPGGNFAQQWSLLQAYFNQMPTTYTYFKTSEVLGLKPLLAQKLDHARGLAGVPFKITSGLRTIPQNEAVGGVSNSAHLTGEAADIACSDSINRFKMIVALLSVDFKRIEISPAHIHVDISTTLPQNVCVLSQNG